MAFLDSVSRLIAGIVTIMFLFVLLPYMYGAMTLSTMFDDPVLAAAGLFLVLVFVIAVIYAAFFRKDTHGLPKGLIEV
jgi:hypothetical protein